MHELATLVMGCGSSSTAEHLPPIDSARPRKKVSKDAMNAIQRELDADMDAILNMDNTMAEKRHDVAEARRLFKEADKDGSGSVDAEELITIFIKLGLEIEKSAVKEYAAKFIADFDKDGSNSIEMKEFFKFYTQVFKAEETRSKYAQRIAKEVTTAQVEAESDALFTKYDADKSGYIDKKELELLLRECLQLQLAEDQFKHFVGDILKHADKSRDKKIDRKEFLNLFKKCLASPEILKKYEEKVSLRYEGGSWKTRK